MSKPSRILTVKVRPSFRPERVLHLENHPVPGQALRYCVIPDGLDNELSREPSVVSREDTDDLVELLKECTIRAFVGGAMGLDATSYEVSFGGGFTAATYRWWLSPPRGREGLGEIVQIVDRYGRGW